MATIIQPYNGWRENLAINLISPLITNMIQRSQEANQNRKLNALRSVVQSALSGQEQNLLSNPSMPENYNNNGWEQALHKTISPLTQYDLGTSGISPIATPTPTVQEHRNEVMKQLGTKRFGMLNPALVEQYFAPMYQNMEQTRQEELKKQAIDAIMNAQNDTARRNAIYSGIIGGYIPESILTSENDMYKYNNISPLQKAGFDMQDKQRTENARQFDAGLAQRNAEFWGNNYLERERMRQNQNQFDATMGYNRETRDIQQGNADRNYYATRMDADRNYELQERQMKLSEEAAAHAERQAELNNLKQQYDAYTARLQELNEEYQNLNDPKQRAYYENEIARIRGLQQQILNQMNNSHSSTTASNSFNNAMQVVFENEGGYVNDPDDRGGATNIGITSATFQKAKRRGLTNANTVQDLTKTEANNIYHELYWKPSNADKLPEYIAIPYFDSVVHHGVTGGAKLLQKAINTFAGQNIVSEDGVIGEQTINALKTLVPDSSSQEDFIDALLNVRERLFEDIVAKNPTQKKFLNGWKNRVNKLRRKKSNASITVLDNGNLQADTSKTMWIHQDGETISENELNEIYRNGLKNGQSRTQIDRELERAGYQRAKRELTPEQDMRPSYMRGNINLPSYISPITTR